MERQHHRRRSGLRAPHRAAVRVCAITFCGTSKIATLWQQQESRASDSNVRSEVMSMPLRLLNVYLPMALAGAHSKLFQQSERAIILASAHAKVPQSRHCCSPISTQPAIGF